MQSSDEQKTPGDDDRGFPSQIEELNRIPRPERTEGRHHETRQDLRRKVREYEKAIDGVFRARATNDPQRLADALVRLRNTRMRNR